MYDENNDDTYDDNFSVNYDIVSVLPAEYDMVSEVSETEVDFVPDETEGGKPLCYYVMKNTWWKSRKQCLKGPVPR